MAFRCGIPVDMVALFSTGPLLGGVRIRRASLVSTLANDTSCSPLPWPAVVQDTERYALFYLAGPAGEAKLLGTSLRAHCCESDLRQCQHVCRSLRNYRGHLVRTHAMSIPRVDPAEMANELLRRAVRILTHRGVWRAVVALAADLEAWRQLSEHDAAETVQWTRRVENQLTLLLPNPPPRPAYTRTSPGSTVEPRRSGGATLAGASLN